MLAAACYNIAFPCASSFSSDEVGGREVGTLTAQSNCQYHLTAILVKKLAPPLRYVPVVKDQYGMASEIWLANKNVLALW